MLRRGGIGAHDQLAPVRRPAVAGPHLLPVDDVVIAVETRRRSAGGQVGSGVRLRETLAPDLLGAEDLPAGSALFCASVPNAMMVGPTMPRPRTLAIGGAPARAISCQKITCCIRLAPRPPYARGQEMPAQPPSYSVFCHVSGTQNARRSTRRGDVPSPSGRAVRARRAVHRETLSLRVKDANPSGTPVTDVWLMRGQGRCRGRKDVWTNLARYRRRPCRPRPGREDFVGTEAGAGREGQ